MKSVYQTSNVLYTEKEMEQAFMHGFSLRGSGWTGDPKQAFREMAEEIVSNTHGKPTVEDIVEATSVVVEHPPHAIADPNTGRSTVARRGRLLACWFAYYYSDLGLEEISEALNYQSHASVIHGCKTVNGFLESDDGWAIWVDLIVLVLRYRRFTLTINERGSLNL